MGRGTDSELVNNSSAACQLWKLRSDGGDAPHKSAHLLLIQRTPPAFVQRLVGWLAGRVARLFPVEINRDSDRGHYLTREVRASSQEPEYPGIFSPKGVLCCIGTSSVSNWFVSLNHDSILEAMFMGEQDVRPRTQAWKCQTKGESQSVPLVSWRNEYGHLGVDRRAGMVGVGRDSTNTTKE